jgi:hypothetical protein
MDTMPRHKTTSNRVTILGVALLCHQTGCILRARPPHNIYKKELKENSRKPQNMLIGLILLNKANPAKGSPPQDGALHAAFGGFY